MIGNDVVDLNLAEPGAWKRKRHLNKVFHPEEQRLIEESENPFTSFWLLWSMKESAYKAHFRKKPIRRFNPSQLRCDRGEGPTGMVQIEGSSYNTRSLVTGEYVHTVALESRMPVSWIQSGVVRVGKAHSLRERMLCAMKEKCADGLNALPENVFFEKDVNGIPYLRLQDLNDRLPCSISHHGNYGAFTFYLETTLVTDVQE